MNFPLLQLSSLVNIGEVNISLLALLVGTISLSLCECLRYHLNDTAISRGLTYGV